MRVYTLTDLSCGLMPPLGVFTSLSKAKQWAVQHYPFIEKCDWQRDVTVKSVGVWRSSNQRAAIYGTVLDEV